MRVCYRKKYPYYGKYKCKAELSWDRARNTFTYPELVNYLNRIINKEDYMIYGYYIIYVKEEKHLDIILSDSRLENIIMFVYRPAVGYENLEGKEPKQEKTLWYDKFSYKITIHVDQPSKGRVVETDKITRWCDENLQYAYRKSGTWGNVSFFFINKHDAVAFKLTFSDIIEKQEILNKKIAVRELKKKIKQTGKDLEIYLEGEE